MRYDCKSECMYIVLRSNRPSYRFLQFPFFILLLHYVLAFIGFGLVPCVARSNSSSIIIMFPCSFMLQVQRREQKKRKNESLEPIVNGIE